MRVLLVRHGESEGNARRIMQGRSDFPLSDLGREQARVLAQWIKKTELEWDVAYASPLKRAAETYDILASELDLGPASHDPEMVEVNAGVLQGLSATEIEARHPEFFYRDVTTKGDFAEYGGESYDELQARVGRVLERLTEQHRDPEQTVLIVGHGGFLFQFVKAAVCRPVPKVAILHFGNCTITQLQFRDRRGTFMGEVTWHVPIELMGGQVTDGVRRLF